MKRSLFIATIMTIALGLTAADAKAQHSPKQKSADVFRKFQESGYGASIGDEGDEISDMPSDHAMPQTPASRGDVSPAAYQGVLPYQASQPPVGRGLPGTLPGYSRQVPVPMQAARRPAPIVEKKKPALPPIVTAKGPYPGKLPARQTPKGLSTKSTSRFRTVSMESEPIEMGDSYHGPVTSYPESGYGCDSCGDVPHVSCQTPSQDWWYQVDYMHVYLSGRDLPALVTGGDLAGLGVIGAANTVVRFGDGTIGDDRRPGGRVTLGHWFCPEKKWGVAANFFTTEGDNTSYYGSSNGASVIARPFFNIDPLVNAEGSFVVSAPGISQGWVQATTSSDLLNSEVFGKYLLYRRKNVRFDIIGGYQFTRLDDGLAINSWAQSIAPNGQAPIGTQVRMHDLFEATNQFHGGVIGLSAKVRKGCFTLSALGKVALGENKQRVIVNGNTIVTDPANNSTYTPGGLLAQPTNIGDYENSEMTYAPEGTISLTYALTHKVDITVGYTFMYWSSVALAGDQIDRVVNARQLAGGTLVGPARPALSGINDTDFWMQSINIGVSGKF